ncbi:unnamed protein product [Parajaminaea phylloscopi]
MNTSLNRLQAWSGLLLTTVLVLSAAVAFLSYPSPSLLASPYNPSANLTVYNLQTVLGKNRWHPDRRTQEFLEFDFDFRANLLGEPSGSASGAGSRRGAVWNKWNTKQVFLSLVAEWEGPPSQTHRKKQSGSSRKTSSDVGATPAVNTKNQAVLWDRIVRRPEDANVIVQSRNKYGWRAVSGSWSDIASANFSLRWNVMPHVGLLAYGQEAQTGSLPIPVRIVGETQEVNRMPY